MNPMERYEAKMRRADRSCMAARASMSEATDRFKAAVRHAFPIGADVAVDHARGSFNAVVVGYRFDRRVVVRNDQTGHASVWDFTSLTATPGAPDGN